MKGSESTKPIALPMTKGWSTATANDVTCNRSEKIMPKVGSQIGRLDDEDILRLNQAILVFLGLVVSSRTSRERRPR